MNEGSVLVVLGPVLLVLLLIGVVVTASITVLNVPAAQVLTRGLELRVLLDQPLVLALFFLRLVQRRGLDRRQSILDQARPRGVSPLHVAVTADEHGRTRLLVQAIRNRTVMQIRLFDHGREVLRTQGRGFVADGFSGLLNRLLELVFEYLVFLFAVTGQFRAVGPDFFKGFADLIVGVKAAQILGRDPVRLKVVVHVAGVDHALIAFAEDSILGLLALDGFFECGNELGVIHGLAVLDP